MTDTELALAFHNAYERLAPSFVYETRQDTRVFDPASPNGMLMTAVCGEIRALLAAPPASTGVVPAGWRLVPIKITDEMREAFHVDSHRSIELGAAGSRWGAMLAAAPTHDAAMRADEGGEG